MNKQRTPSATLRLLRDAPQQAPSDTSDHKPLSRLADKLACLAESLEKIAQQSASENLDITNHDRLYGAKEASVNQTNLNQTNLNQTNLNQNNLNQSNLKQIATHDQKKSDLTSSKKARHLKLIS